MNPLSLLTMRAAAIAAVIAFGGGTFVGWTVQGWRLNGVSLQDKLNAEVLRNAALEDNLKLIRSTLDADHKAEEVDLQTIEEIDRYGKEAVDAASSKPALSADTVDRLRRAWGK